MKALRVKKRTTTKHPKPTLQEHTGGMATGFSNELRFCLVCSEKYVDPPTEARLQFESCKTGPIGNARA